MFVVFRLYKSCTKNPKSEAQNPKQIRTNKSQIRKIQNTESEGNLEFCFLDHLNLFRISDFVLRIFCSWWSLRPLRLTFFLRELRVLRGEFSSLVCAPTAETLRREIRRTRHQIRQSHRPPNFFRHRNHRSFHGPNHHRTRRIHHHRRSSQRFSHHYRDR
jgi:hypothetical protein